jgi:hypothetical protein
MDSTIMKLGIFRKIDKETAECIACLPPKRLKLSNGSYKGLVIHLNSKSHGDWKAKFDKLEADDAAKLKAAKLSTFFRADNEGKMIF